MTTALVQVTHYADPGCPWDYSAEPVRIALEASYGEQLSWRTVQVGLYESSETMVRRGYTTTGLADSYRIFQERYRMPFCTEPRPRLAGTWPAARAVKAAELQTQAAGADLLRRLRLAWFAEGRLLDEHEELVRVAADVTALDVDRFVADLDADATVAALRRDMEAARRPDGVAIALEKAISRPGEPARYSTPTYTFAREGRSMTVPGFQPLEAYQVALQNLAPELERRRTADAGELLRARPGRVLATVEVAAAIGRSQRRTAEQLEALVLANPVQRTAAGARELWSWGPPAYTLVCPALPRLEDRLEHELAA